MMPLTWIHSLLRSLIRSLDQSVIVFDNFNSPGHEASPIISRSGLAYLINLKALFDIYQRRLKKRRSRDDPSLLPSYQHDFFETSSCALSSQGWWRRRRWRSLSHSSKDDDDSDWLKSAIMITVADHDGLSWLTDDASDVETTSRVAAASPQSFWTRRDSKRLHSMTVCVHRVRKWSKCTEQAGKCVFSCIFFISNLLWYFISPWTSFFIWIITLSSFSSSSSFCPLLDMSLLSRYLFHTPSYSPVISLHHFMAIIHSRKRGVEEERCFHPTSDLFSRWRDMNRQKALTLKAVFIQTANWSAI